MEKVFDKKQKKRLVEDDGHYKLYKLLIASCFFMYMSMMAVKYVFTAELASIMGHYNSGKAQTNLANTFYYITYALTQLVLTFLFGKLNVRHYLIITVPLAGCIYIAVAFLTSMSALWLLFAINGILQAGLWSGCILLLSNYLPEELLSLTNNIMNQGTNVGTITSIAICAIFVSLGLWQLSFVLFGCLLIASVVFFAIVTGKVVKTVPKKVKRELEGDKESLSNKALFSLDTKKKKVLFYILPFIILFLLNCLYYGIMGWIVVYLQEVFFLPESASIILSVCVPIVSVVGPIFFIWLCDRERNYIKIYTVMNFIPLVLLIAMIFLFDKSIVLSLVCLALIIVVVKSTTTVTSVAAFNMHYEINTGSFSAFINAGASVAAGVAPTVIGAIIESTGTYRSQFTVLAAICALMLISSLFVCVFTKKHIRV